MTIPIDSFERRDKDHVSPPASQLAAEGSPSPALEILRSIHPSETQVTSTHDKRLITESNLKNFLKKRGQTIEGTSLLENLRQDTSPERRQLRKSLENIKMPFHVLSDFWGNEAKTRSGKELEGSSFLFTLNYLKQLIALFKSKPEEVPLPADTLQQLETEVTSCLGIEKAFSSINNIQELKDYLPTLFQKFDALPVGGSIIIPGGWIGLPKTMTDPLVQGHAMLYRVTKTEELEGKPYYSFTVYNTGEGVQYHELLQAGYKKKPQLSIEWLDLRAGKIKSPELWLALLEPQFVPRFVEEERPVYESHHIYESLFSNFGKQDKEGTLSKFITGQRAGTCSWKVLNVISHPLFGKDERGRKRYDYFRKFETLTNTFINLEQGRYSDPDEKEAILEILKQGATKLVNSFGKMLDADILTEQEMCQGIATLFDLMQNVDQHQKIFQQEQISRAGNSQQPLSPILGTDLIASQHVSQVEISTQIEALSAVLLHKEGLVPPLSERWTKSIGVGLTHIPIPTNPSEVSAFVESLLDAQRSIILMTNCSATEQQVYLDRIFDALPPRDSAMWDLVQGEDALHCLEAIHHMCELYLNMTRALKCIPPAIAARMTKAYTIGDKLARNYEVHYLQQEKSADTPRPSFLNERNSTQFLEHYMQQSKIDIDGSVQKQCEQTIRDLNPYSEGQEGDLLFNWLLPGKEEIKKEKVFYGVEYRYLMNIASYLIPHLPPDLIAFHLRLDKLEKEPDSIIGFMGASSKLIFAFGPYAPAHFFYLRELHYVLLSTLYKQQKMRLWQAEAWSLKEIYDTYGDIPIPYNKATDTALWKLRPQIEDPIPSTPDKEKMPWLGNYPPFNDLLWEYEKLGSTGENEGIKQTQLSASTSKSPVTQLVQEMGKQIGYEAALIANRDCPNSVSTLLDFMERNTGLLSDKNWQQAFCSVVFRSDELKEYASCEHLKNFIADKIKKCRLRLVSHPNDSTNIDLLLFCYRVIHYLYQSSHMNQYPQLKHELKELIIQSRELVNPLLSQPLCMAEAAQCLILSYEVEESLSVESAVQIFQLSQLMHRHTPITFDPILLSDVYRQLYRAASISIPAQVKQKMLQQMLPAKDQHLAQLGISVQVEAVKEHLKAFRQSNYELVKLDNQFEDEKSDLKIIKDRISRTKDEEREHKFLLEAAFLEESIPLIEQKIKKEKQKRDELIAALTQMEGWIEDYPMYSILSQGTLIQVDFMHGTTYYDGIPTYARFPQKIAQHQKVISFFGKAPDDLDVTLENRTFRPVSKELQNITFTDLGDDVSIDTEFEIEGAKQSFCMLDENERSSLALPAIFQKKSAFTIWMAKTPSAEPRLLICLPGVPPRPYFRVNSDGAITKEGGDPTLTLCNIKDAGMIKNLEALSGLVPDFNDLFVWKNKQGAIEKLELPIKGESGKWLAFTAKGEHFFWDEDPTFFISKRQELSSLNHFPYFLQVENRDGLKKVLIPVDKLTDLKSPKQSKEEFSLGQMLASPDRLKRQYLSFVVDPIKGLQATHKQGALYMAYLKIMEKDYEKAITLLKASPPVTSYIEQEQDQLSHIIDSDNEAKDAHPAAAAVRIFAGYLLKRHDDNTQTSRSLKSYWNPMIENYKNYLTNPNVPKNLSLDVLLSPDEEVKWIDDLLSAIAMAKEKIEKQKLQALSGKTIEKEQITIPSFDDIELLMRRKEHLMSKSLISSTLAMESTHAYEKVPTVPILDVKDKIACLYPTPTRQDVYQTWGGVTVFASFRAWYTIATKGSLEEVSQLSAILEQRQMENEEAYLKDFALSRNQYLYRLLETIIAHRKGHFSLPINYPELPDINHTGYVESLSKNFFYIFEQKAFVEAMKSTKLVNPKAKKSIGVLEAESELNQLIWMVGTAQFETKSENLKEILASIKGQRSIERAVIIQQKVAALEEQHRSICDHFEAFYELPKEKQPKNSITFPAPLNPPIAETVEGATVPEALEETSLLVQLGMQRICLPHAEAPQQLAKFHQWISRLSTGDQQAMKTVQDDLQAYLAQKKTIYTISDPTSLTNAKELFQKQITDDTAEMQRLEMQILTLANQLPEGMLESMRQLSGSLSGKTPTLDMPEVLRLFLVNNSQLWKQETYLSDQEIETLRKTITLYLIAKTSMQYAQRCLKPLKDVQKALEKGEDSLEYQQALQAFGEAVDSHRLAYDPFEKPEYLVFEACANVRIRQDQYDLLQQLRQLDISEEVYNRIVQLIMGGGKSKIITPILSLMKADGYHLSGMVILDSLYGSTTEDIQQALFENFGRQAAVIEFSREKCNLPTLKHIQHTIKHAIKTCNTVIMRPKDQHSLKLMYFERREQIDRIERFYQKKCARWGQKNGFSKEETQAFFECILENKPLPTVTNFEKAEKELKKMSADMQKDLVTFTQEAALLKEILNIISERGVFTYDEVDSAFNTRRQQNFPVGIAEPIAPDGIEAAKHLYYLFLTDPKLIQLIDMKGNNQAEKMTQVDEKELKHYLATQMFPQFRDLANQLQFGEKEFIEYVTGQKTENAKMLLRKMQQARSVHHVDAKTIKLTNQIVFLKKELSKDLEDTLKARAFVSYGLSHRHAHLDIAIPYECSDKPIEGAYFRNIWETVHKTYQYYGQTWQGTHRTKKMVQYLQKEVYKSAGTPREHELKQAFHTTFGMDIGDVSAEEPLLMEKLTNTLDIKRRMSQPEAVFLILEYIADEVLAKQVEFYPEQLNSTTQDLAGMPHSTQGYSGTFAGMHTWSPKVEAIPTEGVDGRSVSALLSEQNSLCHVIEGESPKEVFRHICALRKTKKIDGFIDIAPMFKGIANKDVIAALFTAAAEANEDIQAVLSYERNAAGQSQLALFRRGEKEPQFIKGSSKEEIMKACGSIRPDQLFKYWPEAQIVGSDLPSEMATTAVASFGLQVSLDQLLQGDSRKRGLVKGTEFVNHIITSSSAAMIRKQLRLAENEPITSGHLVISARLYQEQQEQKSNYQASIQMIDYQARARIEQLLRSAPDEKTEKALYRAARHLIVKRLNDDLFEEFSAIDEEVPAKEALKNHIEHWMSKIDQLPQDLFGALQASLKEELQQIVDIQLAKNCLPKTVLTSDCEAVTGEMSVEQQVQTEMQTQQQEEMDFELSQLTPAGENYWPERLEFLTEPSLFHAEAMQLPLLIPLRDALGNSRHGYLAETIGPDVFMTENFLKTFEGQPDVLLSPLQKHVHHMLYIKEGERRYVILLSLQDEDFFSRQFQRYKAELNNPNNVRQVWLIEPHGQLVKGDHTSWVNPLADPSASKRERDTLIETLVWKGDVTRLESEPIFSYFKEWLTECSPEQKGNRQFLFESVLEHLDQDKTKFQSSRNMQKLFKV